MKNFIKSKGSAAAGLVIGFVAVLACSVVEDIQVYAKTVIYGDTQSKLGATKVQAALETLAKKVAQLQTETGTTPDPDCPLGYSSTKVTGKPWRVTCTRTKDVMVKVGSVWVDRYEMVLVPKDVYGGGHCATVPTTGKVYTKAPYPNFPQSGNWTKPLYACSVASQAPAVGLTWFQAAQACAAAGKQICPNGIWQAAAGGTPDGAAKCRLCGTSSSCAAAKTGNNSACESSWGARDMVGNLDEWVAMWDVTGQSTATGNDDYQNYVWPNSYCPGSPDVSWEVFGGARKWQADSKATDGMPAAARRGGNYTNTKEAGVFNIDLSGGPTVTPSTTGARCCII